MNAEHSKFDINNYIPGSIGRVTELHSIYYSKHWGFNLAFESEVARELSEFLERFQSSRDLFRIALSGDTIIGSIAIDGQKKETEGARLRWFITSEEFQGEGLGKTLVDEAVRFSRDAGHSSIFLWTFSGLEAARKLYERAGFILTEEYEDSEWGNSIVHQKFVLQL
jgi:GNAT superfamily N-acetyltransferase